MHTCSQTSDPYLMLHHPPPRPHCWKRAQLAALQQGGAGTDALRVKLLAVTGYRLQVHVSQPTCMLLDASRMTAAAAGSWCF
jgi:hypothetical protein